MSALAALYLVLGLIAVVAVPFMTHVVLGAIVAFLGALCLLCFLVIEVRGIK